MSPKAIAIVFFVVISLSAQAQVQPDISDADALIRAIDGAPGRLEAELRKGVNLNVRGSRRDTPWCYAVTNGRADRVALLLKNGADPNSPFRPPCRINEGERPIHLTVIFTRLDVLKVLIDHGVDINAIDGAGLTALHYAVMSRPPEYARLLIAAGADLHAKGPNGETPANQAEYFLKRGMADPETARVIVEAASKAKRIFPVNW